jgi:hypothetical protein
MRLFFLSFTKYKVNKDSIKNPFKGCCQAKERYREKVEAQLI